MQAPVFAGEGRLELQERPRPQPGSADEVLIAVEAFDLLRSGRAIKVGFRP